MIIMAKIIWVSGTNRVVEMDVEANVIPWLADLKEGDTMELKNSRFIKLPDDKIELQCFCPPTVG
jgi:hypothetical protein